ncbi:GDSL esterase/lipase ENOD8-like [Tasmannia lanceolata]|uniref:GDSL esterase/lipase ENOD8-like n=1 Tax=Tasmannia lanceolata TaxID=3420 RepID=UPI00406438FE
MANSIYCSLFLLWVLLFQSSESKKYGNSKNFPYTPPAMFVFGDSFSDTGNVMAAFPFIAGAENSPYGSTFFGKPSGRFSDGRLIADFIAMKLGFPFVQPYFKNIDTNYRHGINFAVAGGTAVNMTGGRPSFSLPSQTDHFVEFKRNVLAILQSKDRSNGLVSRLPTLKAFKDGIYIIFMGVNDIFNSLFTEITPPFIQEKVPPPLINEKVVPQIISAISKGIEDLHKEGAENFMVFTVPAIGCLPTLLARASVGPFNSTDELGCLKEYNDVVQFSNLELQKALANLTHQIDGINIMVADVYGFMLEAIVNPSAYGFDEKVKFHACCGFGGPPHNYNFNFHCGYARQAQGCSNPMAHISWDGDHFTDAFSQRFVDEMMKGMPYLKPASLFY